MSFNTLLRKLVEVLVVLKVFWALACCGGVFDAVVVEVVGELDGVDAVVEVVGVRVPAGVSELGTAADAEVTIPERVVLGVAVGRKVPTVAVSVTGAVDPPASERILSSTGEPEVGGVVVVTVAGVDVVVEAGAEVVAGAVAAGWVVA